MYDRRILLSGLAGAALSALFLFAVPFPAAADAPVFTRGASVSSHLKAPTGIAVDGEGHLYVTESSRNVLHIFSAGGEHLDVIEGLARPVSVAVDGWGRIYIGNAGRGNVEVYGPDLLPMVKLGSGDGEFGRPTGIAVNGEGTVYVADSRENVVRIYGSDGSPRGSFDGSDNGSGPLTFPSSLAIDGDTGEVFVTDLHSGENSGVRYGGARVQAFSSEGVFLREFAGFGVGEGVLVKPLGVATDGEGRVYVTDAFQNVVQVFARGGSWLTALYDSENPLRTPLGIAWESTGSRVVIASLSSGKVETYALQAGSPAHLVSLDFPGAGTGTVRSDPPGLECRDDCAAEFPAGTVLRLIAEADAGSVFSRWEGDCGGRGTCEVTVNGSLDAAARFVPIPSGDPAPLDFDGDGLSDLLGWNRAEETVSLWFAGDGPLAPGITVGDTAGLLVSGVADFDGDGRADIMVRSAGDGALTLWLMEGAALSSALPVDTLLKRYWEIAATGDFDGDGQADLLARHQISGTVIIWLMDGAAVDLQARIRHSPRRNWEVAGTGDFDGDGKDDVLWRDEDGALTIWLMEGASVARRGLLSGSPGDEWEIAGIGDFSGDGFADILWRNGTDGALYLWVVQGIAVNLTRPAGSIPDPAWMISGGGDYNGDGLADIAGIHGITGEIRLWLTGAAGIAETLAIGIAPEPTVFW